MATDSETRTIKEFLFAHPEHLETAQSVSDAWLKVKEVLCRGFLEHLRAELAKAARAEWPDIAPDLRVGCTYGGEKPQSNYLWLHRASWNSWEGHDKKNPLIEGCTAIVLRTGWTAGPNKWNWGVFHPRDKSGMTDTGVERRTRLEDGLRNKFDGVGIRTDGWWPYIRAVDDEMRNWNAPAPRPLRGMDGRWRKDHRLLRQRHDGHRRQGDPSHRRNRRYGVTRPALSFAHPPDESSGQETNTNR